MEKKPESPINGLNIVSTNLGVTVNFDNIDVATGIDWLKSILIHNQRKSVEHDDTQTGEIIPLFQPQTPAA